LQQDSQELQTRYSLMTETPVEKLVCKMAVPTIITMMITAFYNMADTYFVGKIGTSATAAVGISFSLMSIIQAIGFFFGHGSGNYISRMLGAQKTDDAEKMAAIGFFSSIILGAIISIIGILALQPFTLFLGATNTILPHATAYLTYILIGVPFMTSSLTLNNQLRFQGRAVYGMVGMVSGALVNIILDPIFIFIFHMGVGGAGFATMLSQIASWIILLLGAGKEGNINIRYRNFKLQWRYYREIIRGGLPSLCRQGLASVAVACMNHAAGIYGDAAIAAMSIVNRTANFAGSALIGFGQGFQPVCGFNYGAKLYNRVKKAFWFCLKVSTIVFFILGILGWFFAPHIIALFRNDLEVIHIGTLALRLQCLTFSLLGWITLCNMMLQTIGKAAKASILAMGRQGLFFLPALFILASTFGLLGVQLSQPVADLATFILGIPLGLSVLKEMKEEST